LQIEYDHSKLKYILFSGYDTAYGSNRQILATSPADSTQTPAPSDVITYGVNTKWEYNTISGKALWDFKF